MTCIRPTYHQIHNVPMLEVLSVPIEMATCGLVTKAVIIITGLFLLLPPSSGSCPFYPFAGCSCPQAPWQMAEVSSGLIRIIWKTWDMGILYTKHITYPGLGTRRREKNSHYLNICQCLHRKAFVGPCVDSDLWILRLDSSFDNLGRKIGINPSLQKKSL